PLPLAPLKAGLKGGEFRGEVLPGAHRWHTVQLVISLGSLIAYSFTSFCPRASWVYGLPDSSCSSAGLQRMLKTCSRGRTCSSGCRGQSRHHSMSSDGT